MYRNEQFLDYKITKIFNQSGLFQLLMFKNESTEAEFCVFSGSGVHMGSDREIKYPLFVKNSLNGYGFITTNCNVAITQTIYSLCW